jgi:uridine kinase
LPSPSSPPSARSRLVIISGGSGSGKTTLVSRLCAAVPDVPHVVLGLDHYYRDLSHLPAAERDQRNFDHPESFDDALLMTQLRDLVEGRAIARPTYDFKTHTRATATQPTAAAPIVVLDGILALHWREIRELADLTVFVEVDDDVRFIRRMARDVRERGRTADGVMTQYLASVKAMHDAYVAPQKRVADIIVGWSDYNDRAVAMLASMLRTWWTAARSKPT